MSTTSDSPAKSDRKPANATAASIAVRTGLSRATVTLVLHGRAGEHRIRPETQRRVLEAARELGYRPNASARALRDGRHGNIGLVQCNGPSYLPMDLLRGISEGLSARSLQLMFTEVQAARMDQETFLPGVVRDLSADGLVINRIPDVSPRFLELVREYRIPAVFLNVRETFDAVHPDDRHAGRSMTERLLKLGHQRIAYVGTAANAAEHYSEADRRIGYEAAMQDAGLPSRVFLLPGIPASAEEAINDPRVRAAIPLLSDLQRPTAIVAYELAEALTVVHAARELHLKVPHQLSLITCHHTAEHWIDTVTNAMYPVGYAAVEMLTAKLSDPELQIPSRALRGAYIAGSTCAAPPRDGA